MSIETLGILALIGWLTIAVGFFISGAQRMMGKLDENLGETDGHEDRIYPYE